MHITGRAESISLGVISIAALMAPALSLAGYEQLAAIGFISIGLSCMALIAAQQWRYERHLTEADRSTFYRSRMLPTAALLAAAAAGIAKIMHQPDSIFLLLVAAALGLALWPRVLRIRHQIEQVQARDGSFAPLYIGFALILALGVSFVAWLI